MKEPVLILVQLVLAVGVPMLIGRFAPRRWRLWAVGLWALSPLLVGLAMAASEMASGKASPADLDKLIFGLMLIGSMVLLPWLVTCGVGFGLGVMLRGRGAAEPVAAAAEPAKEVAKPEAAEAGPVSTPLVDLPATDTSGPSLSPPSGWQAAHVGFDHDDLVLDGLAVWSLTWREEKGARVMLAHPAHLTQQHEFTIYSVDDGTRATRFAAAELSNSVWGFYRWVVPADVVSGASADGALRYENDPGARPEGPHDRAGPSARLFDGRSGAVLFDGEAWASSRIVPQADGSLLLSLDHGELQTIFRIDPGAGVCRDLTTAGGARPLAELADAAAAARRACDDPANAYLGRRVAPDGALKVDLQLVEWSNTHWVRSPRVTEIATGRVLLDLWGTDWDAWPTFPRAGTVRLSFRRYHFGGSAEVEIELAPERYILFEGAGAVTGPLRDLPEALEAASRRAAAAAPPRPMIAPPRVTARSWLVALLILVGTLGLIAAATLITLKVQGDPAPPRLDTIPPMPGRP